MNTRNEATHKLKLNEGVIKKYDMITMVNLVHGLLLGACLKEKLYDCGKAQRYCLLECRFTVLTRKQDKSENGKLEG